MERYGRFPTYEWYKIVKHKKESWITHDHSVTNIYNNLDTLWAYGRKNLFQVIMLQNLKASICFMQDFGYNMKEDDYTNYISSAR
jgi:hypothetical protein